MSISGAVAAEANGIVRLAVQTWGWRNVADTAIRNFRKDDFQGTNERTGREPGSRALHRSTVSCESSHLATVPCSSLMAPANGVTDAAPQTGPRWTR
jgi:hypothetical protein